MTRRIVQAPWLAAVLLAGTACLAEGARVEAADRVEEPGGYRTGDYRSPVPATLRGAGVVDTAEMARIWRRGAAILVDVLPRPVKPDSLPAGTIWRDRLRPSVPGASWLPNVGYGVLPPAVERYFADRLQALTGGDPRRALVFFCERHCWMSWNAAKRAMAMGYRNVAWYPDGTDGWREANLPLVEIELMP